MNNKTTTTKSNSTLATISIEYEHISELSTHFGAGAFFDRFAEKWTCGYCRQQFIDRESAIKHSENCNE